MGRRKVAAWEWFVYGAGVGFWLNEAQRRLDAWQRHRAYRKMPPIGERPMVFSTQADADKYLAELEEMEAVATESEERHPWVAQNLHLWARDARRPYVVKDDAAAVG
jgi:hypothetical protein